MSPLGVRPCAARRFALLLSLAGCTHPAASRGVSEPPSAAPAPVVALPSPSLADAAARDAATAVAATPLIAFPRVATVPPMTFVDRTLAVPLPPRVRIDVRFVVEAASHRSSAGVYQTLTGFLRIPQLHLERALGGSTEPSECDASVGDDGVSMDFRCSGDSEMSRGRVWVEGERLMLQVLGQREDATPVGLPDNTAERYPLPTGARVRFQPGHGSLGMGHGGSGS